MAPGHDHAARGPGCGRALLLFASFAAFAFALYQPALRGDFVSDDVHYVVANRYVQAPTVASTFEVVDPTSPAKLYTAHYAPVHVLAHMLEWQLFGPRVFGYHLINVALHALNATLLVVLLMRSGVPVMLAAFGGGLFLVHPANVEAVAWISQLKSLLALALAFAALLAHRRQPALGAVLFGLALLAKASAFSALPMAAALTWAWSLRGEAQRRHWIWLGVWTIGFALYSVPMLSAHTIVGTHPVPEFDDPLVHARTIAAIGMRYLVMAVSGYGVAAFQEPTPAVSVWNGWWLASLVPGALLAWRALFTLRGRREEAAWWIAAAASFGPISQISPMFFPVADRYLYFILPGLIGGTCLLGLSQVGRLDAAWLRSRWVPAAAGLIAAAWLLPLALQTYERAHLWRSERLLVHDGAVHYPDGGAAWYLRAVEASRSGHADRAAAALRRAAERRYFLVRRLAGDPSLADVHDSPEFAEVVRELARSRIEFAERYGRSTQRQLRWVGHAHVTLGEYDAAERAFEQAIRAGGPLRELLLLEIDAVARRRAQAEGGAPSEPLSPLLKDALYGDLTPIDRPAIDP